ncbi:MAG: hypothetical protein FJ023_01110 [Chloroflexi bacterium]|nr:hypothetical protein [Chloroflexota bacterium]
MTEDKILLTEVEAQQIAEKFLLSKCYESKISFSGCQLIATDDSHIYHLCGDLTIRSRSSLSRFTGPKSANKYRFRIEINAQQGKVLNYEII